MVAIDSFSGTHLYDIDCVKTSVELDWIDQDVFDDARLDELSSSWARRVNRAVTESTCPRCGDKFDEHLVPAGSRVTICRCIPICSACGEDEAFQEMLNNEISRVWQWPVSKSARTRRKNKVMANGRLATMVGDQVLSKDGVTRIKPRPHPGGWAEYGHDSEQGA